MNEFLSACRMKSFGNDGIVCFAHGKVAGGSICRYDPESNALRSLFIDGYEEGCVERPSVVRVKHLQAFDNAIAYQEFAVSEFSVNPNLHGDEQTCRTTCEQKPLISHHPLK
jgi:hypothetical protein